ncbi:MAG TPA: glutamine--fructose-6-phosphate transaminase (isomerizing) [Myxococcota bacterium]|nr:glutamine--fructose-6-phosphate transaminase (isomerizing) [Myxococcota bacterium]
MCGIVGVAGGTPCMELLVDGLRKLEYRGYDSAGVAIIEGHELATARSEGKLDNLARRLYERPLTGVTGIGHTRWATHGKPSEHNAHPHRSGSVAVVHNGIIENHLELKSELMAAGYVFHSETDTEVIAHLIAMLRTEGRGLEDAVLAAVNRLIGAYAIVVVDANEPGVVVGAKLASPLIVGLGKDKNFLASDVAAVLSETRDIVFLEEGQLATITKDRVVVRDIAGGREVEVAPTHITWSPAMAEKGGYKHFMLKEIHEQPRAIADTLRGRISLERNAVDLPELNLTGDELVNAKTIYLVACGTSWHAALVGRYFIEDLSQLAVHVELGSEMRYRNAPIDERSIVIAISQSGETADTLAAIREAKKKGAKVLSICNVIGSSIPRESAGTLYTHAGPEIGVASTKAFTTQLVALHLLAIHFGRLTGRLSDEACKDELEALVHAPALVEHALTIDGPDAFLAIAKRWHEAHSMLYLGRGTLYPLALEGALKLKEISYIHAEGQAAGEMKHGPIALIDERVPTVILNPRDAHYHKVRSNLAEVNARSGPIILVKSEGETDLGDADHALTLPVCAPRLLPLMASIPMQLLAYYMADFKGTDVDQPRNLAKSVTVE